MVMAATVMELLPFLDEVISSKILFETMDFFLFKEWIRTFLSQQNILIERVNWDMPKVVITLASRTPKVKAVNKIWKQH